MDPINLNNLNVDANGRVSFSGLSSGIDLQGTVDAIIAARRIPVDRLEATVEANTDKIAALQDLRVLLESMRTSLSRLYGQISFGGTSDIFAGKQAFAASSRIDGQTASAAGNLVGVTVGNAAAAGNHTIEILQTAKSQKISSDQQSSATTALGFTDGDQFTITSDTLRTSFESAVTTAGTDTLGGSSGGTLTFTDANGTTLGTVAYLTTDTVQDFATAITTNVTDVTATVVNTANGVRLEITGDEEFRIAETGAGNALTDWEIGVTKVNVNSATTLQDLRDLINQANTGSNATGVNASVVTVTSSESYLVLTSADTGVNMTLADTNGTPLGDIGVLTGSSIKNELQAAQDARLYADGILDQTNLNYETDLQTSSAVQIGSAGTLTFADGASGSVAYLATDSLATLAANINTNITGATAEVVTDGAGVRLEITGPAAFTFSETGGGTAIDDLGIDNARKVITRSSNTIDDLFNGVTLSLFAAEQGTTISLDIEQDLSQVKTEIFSFVESYNAIRQYVNGNRLFNSATGELDQEAGVLAKSQALSTVSSQLSQIVGIGVAGVDTSFSVLSQIGINFVDVTQEDPLLAENLEIDEALLDNVLLSNADDVRKLFNFSLTSSDPRVTLLNFTGETQYSDSGYALNFSPATAENMLQYSEQADNAFWTATNSTVSADALLAPNNTTTADGLVADLTSGTHLLSTAAPESFTTGENYIYSTYVKAGDRDNARIAFNGAAFGGSPIGADFDLVGGTVQSQDAGVSDANIEDVGDGWYRVSIKATAVATDTANLETYSKDATTTFTGDGATVSTYVWGSQLEGVTTETTPSSYVSTTSAPIVKGTVTANINGPSGGGDDGSVTVSGNVITVNTGGAAGLQLFFNGLDTTSTTQLDMTVGVGAQMYFKLGELLDVTTGIVDAEIDELTDQNELNNERITEMLDRLEIQRQNLLERYIAMETAIRSANSIMDSLSQTVDQLSNSGG